MGTETETELRGALYAVMYELPDYMKGRDISDLLLKVVDLAREGLEDRGYGEDKYLMPLYERAEKIMSPAREMVDGIRAGRSVRDMIDRFAGTGEY